MKKLTAGIFATILGLTAVDAFAAIPSKGYVDTALKEKQDVLSAANAGANVSITEENGVVKISSSYTDTNTEYSAGNGLELDGTTFNANVAEVVAGTDNVTVKNENGTVTVSVAGDGDTTYTAGDYVEIVQNEKGENVINTTFKAGANVDIAADGTISSSYTDTNTEYSAGNGLELDGTTFNANVAEVVAGTDNVTVKNENGTVTVSVEGTDTVLDGYGEGSDGIQLLTRKYDAATQTYTYVWETIDRSFAEGDETPNNQ